MMNVIAIVGRPNVGKSTLFNRIIGRREAIVEEEPGVTRDRIYGKGDWAGKYFTIIDTGGIVPDSEEMFDRAIREQAQLAIEEADSIIFVCDGRDGLTAIDQEIAEILLRSGKHVTLAINKCDNPSGDANRWDFAVLGLGEPFTFSALNGRSTGEMLDHAIEPLRDQDEEPEDPRLKIAVVGRPNAGKSSLVNALLGQERMIVTPIAGTTRDAIDSVIKHYGEEVVLIDTAGLRRRSRVTENIELYSIIRTQGAIERCDVAVVMIDAEIGMEHQDKRIIADVIEQRKGIIIAVNKWDIIEKDHRTADEYAKKMREEFATADYAPIIFISALTKQRITKIIEMAKDIQLRRTTRISTSKLNDWMEPIIEKQPPPAVNARDLRINYVTQVKVAPPTFAFFLNHPELLPDSYKRFMERRMRDAFDLEGVPVSFLFKRKNVKREDE